jgi:hypothetical protein
MVSLVSLTCYYVVHSPLEPMPTGFHPLPNLIKSFLKVPLIVIPCKICTSNARGLLCVVVGARFIYSVFSLRLFNFSIDRYYCTLTDGWTDFPVPP